MRLYSDTEPAYVNKSIKILLANVGWGWFNSSCRAALVRRGSEKKAPSVFEH